MSTASFVLYVDGCCEESADHLMKNGSWGSAMSYDTDLQPPKFQTGLRRAVSIDSLALEAGFDCGEIVDRDAPAHPAAAELGTSPDGLTEGRRESGRMLQGFHDFEVMTVR